MIAVVVMFIIAASLLAIDLISKVVFMSWNGSVVVPKILSIEPVRNYGAAFGLFQSARVFLIIVTCIILTIGLIAYFRYPQWRKSKTFNVGFAFVFGGALGNLYDRLFMKGGFVRDFINFDFLNFMNFPICNLADVFLNIGMLLLIVYFVFLHKGKSDAKNKS
jgi:signal peptidase II